MAMDRRKTTGIVAVIVAVIAIALFFGWEKLFPGQGGSSDATVDVAALHEPGPLGDVVLGNADAPVTIVEYASMTCPHCANFHAGAFTEIKSRYIDTGHVRFIFREFPLDDLALFASMLARCGPQERFYPMIDVLFETQSVWTANDENQTAKLFEIARLAGFTNDAFEACRTNEEIARGIRDTQDRAASRFGVRATPSLFVNGRLLENTRLETIEAAIADAAG